MNCSYNVPTSIYVAQTCTGRTRSFANLSLRPFYSLYTDLFIGSFLNRIVTLWNHFSVTIRQQSSVFSLLSFITNLYKCFFMKFDHDFGLHVLVPGNRSALVVGPSTCFCAVDVWSRLTFHFLTYQLADKKFYTVFFFSLCCFLLHLRDLDLLHFLFLAFYSGVTLLWTTWVRLLLPRLHKLLFFWFLLLFVYVTNWKHLNKW